MPNTPTENTVYCLHVTDVCKMHLGVIVSFEFGIISYTGDTPDYAEELTKKFPFLLKQTSEAVENGVGVYPYGAIVAIATGEAPPTPIKLRVVPCGNISHLPDGLMNSFKTNGYLETDDTVNYVICAVGDVYPIGASDGT